MLSQESVEFEDTSEPGIYSHLILDSYEGPKNAENKCHGQGRAKFGGGVYSGSFANGYMEGRGQFVWPNGTVYAGDFKKSKISGSGIYTWYGCYKWTAVGLSLFLDYQQEAR